MLKKRRSAPETASVAPAETDPERGLSEEQAQLRASAGLRNTAVAPPSKTAAQIILSNVFTYFNLLFLLLAACVAAVHSWHDLLFLGVIVVNTLIGIVQELRSKRTLDRLRILTSPKARAIRGGQTVTLSTEELRTAWWSPAPCGSTKRSSPARRTRWPSLWGTAFCPAASWWAANAAPG